MDEIADAIVDGLVRNRVAAGLRFRPGVREALRGALAENSDEGEDKILAALGRVLKDYRVLQ